MGHNNRPHINVSELRPEHVRVSNDRVAQLVCPDCGEWRQVRRHMIEPHTCPGGGQRIWIDVDVAVIERHHRRQQVKPDPHVLRTTGKPLHVNPFEKREAVPARTSREVVGLPVRM